MKRFLLLASGLLVLSVFPAASAAATHGEGAMFSDAVTVRAYKMQLIAFPKTAHSGAGLEITFTRGSSSDKQSHYYGFVHGVHVTLSSNGTSGTIKAKLGAYGHIDLTFAAGAGGRTTPGCPGSFLFQHPGTLTGSFRFKTNSSYFGTIDKNGFRAFTATGKKGINCKPATPILTRGTELDVFSEAISGGAATLHDFSIQRDLSGHVLEQFLVLEPAVGKTGPTIIHSIDAGALPASAFTNAADLSSAQASTSSAFMSGSLSYTSSAMTAANQTVGSVTGSITARFDGLSPIDLPANGGSTQANLRAS